MSKPQVIRDWQARLDAATAPLPRRTSMWLEDPNSPSGWTWRPPEPRAEATHLLPAYRRHELRETPMTQPDDGLVSYDPNDPHDPSDDMVDDGPEHWTGSDPAMSRPETGIGTETGASDSDLVVCPNCGTGVHPDRLRES